MKLPLLLAGVLLSTAATAQTDMYTGGWSTDNASKITAIAIGPAVTSKVYRITCDELKDASLLKFTLIVDGTPLVPALLEGSYVVVEGKNVLIQQKAPGPFLRGTWKVIQQPESAAEKVAWIAYPQLAEEQLVASLKTEQEFVLSLDSNKANCPGTFMTVLVDGQPLKDNAGNVIPYAQGSSVVARGKLVTIKVTGSCSNPNFISGTLALKK